MNDPDKKILIVDDDSIDREAVRRSLRRPQKDIAFWEASSGAEAIDLMEKHAFECVFLDYNLPDIDGISVLRKFYNSEKGIGAAPIVMLTGQGNEAVMIDAIRWGAQDYLVKDSISPDTLKIALTKAKEMFHLQKDKYLAEERLRQSSKMEAVGQLTSGMAHDFNNLLTVVLGNTRLMTKRLEDGDEKFSKVDLRKKVNAIEAAAQKGADLVQRLMIFTRQRESQLEILNVNQRIEEIHELLERTLGEIIETKLVLPDGVWLVEMDASQFENALINLAVNARDAMPKGGRLTLETKNISHSDTQSLLPSDIPSGDYVLIAISDTGKGMSEEIRQRIFEPFYTTKGAGEGTGLGLSMVYGFVGQSKGFIHVYSEEGYGTVFKVYLPRFLGSVEETQTPMRVTDTVQSLATGTETILIMEDNDAVREVTVNTLSELGYNVLQASGGHEALRILKQEHRKIDLLFTDIVIPGGMSGTKLVSEVRKLYPRIEVLFTSGYSENAIPDCAYIEGGYIIEKPYPKELLAKKVRLALDKGV